MLKHMNFIAIFKFLRFKLNIIKRRFHTNLSNRFAINVTALAFITEKNVLKGQSLNMKLSFRHYLPRLK